MVTASEGQRRKLTVRPLGDQRAPLRGRGPQRGSETGQAVVEFVALWPVLLLAALAMGQGAVAGYAAWSAAGAARIGARAEALGAAPRAAVEAELPRFLDRGLQVAVASSSGDHAGQVTVHLRIPSLLPGLRFGRVAGRAQLPSQVGL